ncbi:hypothetical protein HGRIS_007081 [Hohenbuehelia grisea]|uniref:Uncharacterized protein n=1 Tax=Hohenbuehelia grisea TaxID=104357 RepID=A0ABR3JB36_9AGAR
MIIDEKSMARLAEQQPPPYEGTPPPTAVQRMSLDVNPIATPPPPFPHHQARLGPPSLAALPAHILLHVVYMTFPQTAAFDEGRLERQRKTLYWLCTGLRLVNRSFYIACMHVLRSTYLPAYDSLIRSPYTSDPFPLLSSSRTPGSCASPSSPRAPSYSTTGTQAAPEGITTIQRETAVLDLFIAVKVHEDVWADDTELHIEREESFKDLFDLAQPRARLEDLVRAYGVREGVIAVSPSSAGGVGSGTSTPTRAVAGNRAKAGSISKSGGPSQPPPMLFGAMSVSFSSRKVGLVLTTTSRKRTVVDVSRTRDEPLEAAAKRLVRELGNWLRSGRNI